jgi:hypothetical protein
VTGLSQAPVALVDIDGVISIFGFDPRARPDGQFVVVEGIIHFLSAPAGGHLRRLSAGYELAWCSGWEEKANEHLPAVLGLPGPLPHLTFDCRPGSGAHWKLSAIDTFAGPDRPLAWIDDAHGEATRAWAARRRGPTRLVRTDPSVGLTAADVDELLAWARMLGRRLP